MELLIAGHLGIIYLNLKEKMSPEIPILRVPFFWVNIICDMIYWFPSCLILISHHGTLDFFSQINEFFDKRIGISQEISTYFFYLFQLYNVIPLRTIREVIVEKVGSGEVCFNSSFLSYSIVIPPHKK